MNTWKLIITTAIDIAWTEKKTLSGGNGFVLQFNIAQPSPPSQPHQPIRATLLGSIEGTDLHLHYRGGLTISLEGD